jgi:enamine deaminase RidA (YjgF/YER057c/UK114 family)
MLANQVGTGCGPAVIDSHVAAFNPARLVQTSYKRREASLYLGVIRGARHQQTDAPHPVSLLRPRHQRPGRRRAAEQGDELAPPDHVPSPSEDIPQHTLSGSRAATDFKGGLAQSSGKKQTVFILDCMDAICRAGGTNLKNVAWTQNFYSRADDLFPSMEVWNEVEPPATLVAGVGSPVFGDGCTIHIDAVAAVDW